MISSLLSKENKPKNILRKFILPSMVAPTCIRPISRGVNEELRESKNDELLLAVDKQPIS
jgi:hypothetical protein